MPSDMYKHYKVGDRTEGGITIKDILFHGSHFIIFMDENEQLRGEYDGTVCVEGDKSVVEAAGLLAQLDAIGARAPVVTKGRKIIAAGLACAFDYRVSKDPTDFFKTASAFIASKSQETVQALFLLSALIPALYLVNAIRFPGLLGLTPNNQEWSRAIGFGAIGALLSVLQRFKDIRVPPYSASAFVVLDGSIRIALGATFGMVLLLLQKADLLLGATSANSYATALFALIAGLNERFIPNLLERAAGMVEKGEKQERLKTPANAEKPPSAKQPEKFKIFEGIQKAESPEKPEERIELGTAGTPQNTKTRESS